MKEGGGGGANRLLGMGKRTARIFVKPATASKFSK